MLPMAGGAFLTGFGLRTGATASSTSAATTQPDSGSAQEDAGYQLCINSNLAETNSSGAAGGHAWLTLQQDQNVIQGNGLWPDDHPDIVASGLNNGEDSDIRTGFDVDSTVGEHQFCADLGQDQLDNYVELLNEDEEWGLLHNCSSWASEVFEQVTGIDVDADDERLLGAETPSELGQSIQELNNSMGGDNTSNSSSSSSR